MLDNILKLNGKLLFVFPLLLSFTFFFLWHFPFQISSFDIISYKKIKNQNK